MQSNKLIFILISILIVIALGSSLLYKNRPVIKKTAQNAPNLIIKPQSPQPKGNVSVDDDPGLGDVNAPITIIEFSDYECPFCKQFYKETLPQLKEKYINSGKAKFVYRDFPLPFHDPSATKEAVAANCAKKQGGDSKYFEYHNGIFDLTQSNGIGISQNEFEEIASNIGLELDLFNICLNDKTNEGEVKNDVNDGLAAGISGTPTFIIGRTTVNREIDGELVHGAQPLAVFQAIIDPMLQ